MSIYEVSMMVCFGLSWPVSIAKALRTHIVAGKSPVFMIIVCLGYLSGIIHKVMYAFDWVIALYAVNLLMVLVDLTLYMRFRPRAENAVATPIR